jgi:hypothetical protein
MYQTNQKYQTNQNFPSSQMNQSFLTYQTTLRNQKYQMNH